MSLLTYIGKKILVTGIRLAAPGPGTPEPDEVRPILSRDTDRTIKAHIYKSSTSSAPSPVLLNFHGSGFVLPHHGSDDVFCRHIANKTKYTVFDIQYRLAPEHPFPAALNDVEDVIKYVLSHPKEFDASHVSLSGFSAGGNLVLGVLSTTDLPPKAINSVIAFYPVVDLSIEPGEKIQPDTSLPNVLPASVSRIFDACYIGNGDTKDPRVSPAFMNIAKLPLKVLLVTCACDTLALETERFGEKIKKEGGEGRNLVCKRIKKVGHGWDKSCKIGSEDEKKRDDAYDLAVDILNP